MKGAAAASGLTALTARIDARSLRERALGFVILLALTWAAWDQLLLGPLDARRSALQLRVSAVEADVASLNAHAARLAGERRHDPDAGPRAELARLRRESSALDSRLVALTGRLVSPRRMAAVLESVLARNTELELVRLQGLGAERVAADESVAESDDTAPAAGAGVVAARPALWRHRLRLELEGAYLPALDYLRALERLESRFLWEVLELEVLEHPRADVAITVHSLSLDDAWIGI